MGENSKIEWTDHTFNAWRGCEPCSPGCKNCYAKALAARFGEDFVGVRIKLSDAGWKKPLKWNREAAQFEHWSNIHRPRVFCPSLADIFEDWNGPIVDHKGEQLFWPHNAYQEPRKYIPESDCGGDEPPVTMNDLRRDLFRLIDATPHLDWLLVTKRPENIRRMWPARVTHTGCRTTVESDVHRQNCWLLTSVENQETADQRIPELLKCRDLAPVLGLSCEPLWGPINLHAWLCQHGHRDGTHPEQKWSDNYCSPSPCIDWTIVGGESGTNARLCETRWIRSIRDQCKLAGVPVFIKQLGSFVLSWGSDEGTNIDWTWYESIGRPQHIDCWELPLNDRKGGDPSEWAEDLRVREFPNVEVQS